MNHTDATPSRRRPSALPAREDCWSEDATLTLVEAWGDRYLELNRGNLRQKLWQEVADAVNFRHADGKIPRRTDVQCKNRIDTLKKKYKMEKARIVSSNGTLTSSWPLFPRLDALISSTPAAVNRSSPPVAVPIPYGTPSPALPPAVAVHTSREKRPIFRRDFGIYGGFGGADVDSGSSRSNTECRREEGEDEEDGLRALALAVVRFGKIYERVEEAKQRQMIELEKQRMEFAKGLEFQRMQLFVDSQVQLEKIKRARRAASASDADNRGQFGGFCHGENYL